MPEDRFYTLKNSLVILGMAILCIFAVLAISTDTVLSDAVQIDENKIIKIAAVGDSNTRGSGVSSEDIEKYSYPSQLQTLLGNKYEVLNYGLDGTTVTKTTEASYTEEASYKQSQDAQPDIVLIMLGTNDSKSFNWDAIKYEQDLRTFIDAYKQIESKPKVYVLTVPFAYTNGNELLSGEINGDVVTNQVVPIIKRVAQNTNTALIDIYAVTKNHPELFPDKIHANADGYGIIAKQIYEVIQPN